MLLHRSSSQPYRCLLGYKHLAWKSALGLRFGHTWIQVNFAKLVQNRAKTSKGNGMVRHLTPWGIRGEQGGLPWRLIPSASIWASQYFI